MGVKASSWYWEHSTQKGSRLLLLLAIADNADDFGVATPGIARLAHKIRLNERQTQYLCRKLQKDGELKIEVRRGMKTASGFTNRYTLTKFAESVRQPSEGVQFDAGQGVQSSAPKSNTLTSDKKHSTPENGVGRKSNPWYDAVKATWGYEAGKNGSMVAMLQGRATKAMKSDWHKFNLTVEISPDEVLKWAAWYRATKLHGDAKMNLCEKHDEVQSSITAWVNLGKPSAVAITTDPLAGITVIRAGA